VAPLRQPRASVRSIEVAPRPECCSLLRKDAATYVEATRCEVGKGLEEIQALCINDCSLAADDVAVVDGATEQRTAASADDCAERLPSARRDDIPQHASGDAAHDQPGRAIVTLAVVTIVRAAVDAVVSPESFRPSRLAAYRRLSAR